MQCTKHVLGTVHFKLTSLSRGDVIARIRKNLEGGGIETAAAWLTLDLCIPILGALVSYMTTTLLVNPYVEREEVLKDTLVEPF